MYSEKISFDNKVWYKLEWLDIEFNTFSNSIKDCSNIEELKESVLTKFPNCNLRIYEI
jgi:hypothetical protein